MINLSEKKGQMGYCLSELYHNNNAVARLSPGTTNVFSSAEKDDSKTARPA